MAKLRGTVGKIQEKTNKSGGKKLSPIKTKKDSGTKSTDKILSTSKISKTSKTAISKTKKTTVTKILKKKVKDVSWLKGFMEKSKQNKKKSILKSGIRTYNPCLSTSLTIRTENGVDYAMFPWQENRCCGFIKMSPRGFKQKSRSTSTVHLTVLLGKVQLLADKSEITFDCGSMIKIPKGVQYGLKNITSRETYLRFQSICE